MAASCIIRVSDAYMTGKEDREMKYAIVYSTRTGNTKMLADAVMEALEGKDVIYAGVPDDRAYEADVIFLGFWTDKGKPNEESAEVLRNPTYNGLLIHHTMNRRIRKFVQLS